MICLTGGNSYPANRNCSGENKNYCCLDRLTILNSLITILNKKIAV